MSRQTEPVSDESWNNDLQAFNIFGVTNFKLQIAYVEDCLAELRRPHVVLPDGYHLNLLDRITKNC